MVLLRRIQRLEAREVRNTWKVASEGWNVWTDDRWPPPPPTDPPPAPT
jgi:hypothetical protein